MQGHHCRQGQKKRFVDGTNEFVNGNMSPFKTTLELHKMLRDDPGPDR
jgi:hypothetical protein